MTGEARQPDSPAAPMKVFISYSRRDLAFASELKLALEDRGYVALVDHEEIDPNDKWKVQLGRLIFSCDTVVFVLSKDSAGSPVCAWEVEEAARLGKRMLVVTPDLVPAGVDPPKQLADTQWISCWRNPDVPDSSFMRGLIDLDRALKTNLAWLRQGTWLSEQAQLWRARGATQAGAALLLRGSVLLEAIDWMRETPVTGSVPPEVAAFIAASERAEAALQAEAAAQIAEREQHVKATEKANRRTLAVSILLAVLALAGGFLAAQSYSASSGLRSTLLARESNGPLDAGDAATAMLTALEADPAAQAGPVVSLFNGDGFLPARHALVRAVTQNRLEATIGGQGDGVTSVVFNKDGKRFLTGSTDGAARLWTIGADRPPAVFREHTRKVTSVAFHADGERFLTGSDDGTIKLWRVRQTDKSLETFVGHDGEVASVELHPDGQRFLTGSYDGTAKLWRIGQPDRPLATFRGNAGAVHAVVMDPDGVHFLTGSSDGTVKRWRIDEREDVGEAVATWEAHEGTVTAIAFHANRVDFFFTASQDGTVKLWSNGDARPLDTFDGHDGAVTSLVVLDDQFLTASEDRTIRQWEIVSGEPLATRRGHSDGITSIALQPDGTRVLTLSRDGTARLWRISRDKPLRQIGDTRKDRVAAVAFDANAGRVLAGTYDGTAQVWQIGGSAMPQVIKAHQDRVTAVAFHPDGKRFLTASRDGIVKLWLIGKDTSEREFTGNGRGAVVLAFHPDGSQFLVGSADGTARLWRLDADNSHMKFSEHTGAITSVSFDTDGGRILTGSDDGTIKLWQTDEEKSKQTFSGHRSAVASVAFHRDGSRFLVGSADGTIRLWQVDQANAPRTFTGHASRVASIDFHSDGESFVTGSDDGTARLWRIDEDRPLVALYGGGGGFSSVAFQLDGAGFVTGSDRGVAELWQLPEIVAAPARDQVRLACETLARIGVRDFPDPPKFLGPESPHPCRDVWGFDPRKDNPGLKANLQR